MRGCMLRRGHAVDRGKAVHGSACGMRVRHLRRRGEGAMGMGMPRGRNAFPPAPAHAAMASSTAPPMDSSLLCAIFPVPAAASAPPLRGTVRRAPRVSCRACVECQCVHRSSVDGLKPFNPNNLKAQLTKIYLIDASMDQQGRASEKIVKGFHCQHSPLVLKGRP